MLNLDPALERAVGVPGEPVPARVEEEGDGDRQAEGADHEALGREIRKQRRRVEDRRVGDDRLPHPGPGDDRAVHEAGRNGQGPIL